MESGDAQGYRKEVARSREEGKNLCLILYSKAHLDNYCIIFYLFVLSRIFSEFKLIKGNIRKSATSNSLKVVGVRARS